MKYERKFRKLLLIIGVCGSTSCAIVQTPMESLGVEIQRVNSSRAVITTAGFFEDYAGPILRGSVKPNPVSKSPLPGHIDISIVAPNNADVQCASVRPLRNRLQVRKVFSLRVDTVPPPGSVVRIWYHLSSRHLSCGVVPEDIG